MNTQLEQYILGLEQKFEGIGSSRKLLLQNIAQYISNGGEALNFICTHNSRRSQFGQVWATVAAYYYGVKIKNYSGGTKETAFNNSAINALKRAGFTAEVATGKNPKVALHFAAKENPILCFSKTFDAPTNPKSNFAAVMTCAHADENCPFVPGAEKRFALTFTDPKEADGTPEETESYDKSCLNIATEIFFIFHLSKNNVNV